MATSGVQVQSGTEPHFSRVEIVPIPADGTANMSSKPPLDMA